MGYIIVRERTFDILGSDEGFFPTFFPVLTNIFYTTIPFQISSGKYFIHVQDYTSFKVGYYIINRCNMFANETTTEVWLF